MCTRQATGGKRRTERRAGYPMVGLDLTLCEPARGLSRRPTDSTSGLLYSKKLTASGSLSPHGNDIAGGDFLKATFVTLATALLAAAVGAGTYAFYESLTAQTHASVPASMADEHTSEILSQFSQFPSFTTHPGKEDADGSPTSNARLCVNSDTQCFALSTKKLDSQTTYFFGLDPKVKRVALNPTSTVTY